MKPVKADNPPISLIILRETADSSAGVCAVIIEWCFWVCLLPPEGRANINKNTNYGNLVQIKKVQQYLRITRLALDASLPKMTFL